jgi:hypothetical protein
VNHAGPRGGIGGGACARIGFHRFPWSLVVHAAGSSKHTRGGRIAHPARRAAKHEALAALAKCVKRRRFEPLSHSAAQATNAKQQLPGASVILTEAKTSAFATCARSRFFAGPG